MGVMRVLLAGKAFWAGGAFHGDGIAGCTGRRCRQRSGRLHRPGLLLPDDDADDDGLSDDGGF